MLINYRIMCDLTTMLFNKSNECQIKCIYILMANKAFKNYNVLHAK